MRFRLAALLCLTGAAACSHNTEAPNTGADATAQTYPSDSTVDTASNANSPPAVAADTSSTPRASGTDATTDVRAPLVADTKGTSANAFKADPPRTNAAKPPEPPPSTPPNNTKINERDTSSTALTPLDQRENSTDLKITQNVRKAVMGDSTLSFTAKNVKIITQSGKVTLRGPVKNAQERDAIDAAARKVAGVTQVDNQIEVEK